MARLWILTQFLLVLFAVTFLPFDSNAFQGAPQSPRVAGVFMLIEGGQYTLNFTAARAACLSLNVTIATKDQMERALQRGLELCKYGWIAEQIAAIPRITSDRNCGKNKTGLVLWFANPDKTFGVFCFNASDSEETQRTSKAAPRTSASPTTLTWLTQTRTTTPTTLKVKSTTRAALSRRPKTTKSPEQTAASTLLIETTRSTRISSGSTSLDPFTTHIPTSLSHLVSSKSTGHAAASSAAVSVGPQSKSSAKAPLGVVPTALIILGVILFLLTAAGAMWNYKLTPVWFLGQQRDDTETEMWKHTNSEMDLHSQNGAEDDEYEDPDRKYSSDITLCVNPDIRIHSSE